MRRSSSRLPLVALVGVAIALAAVTTSLAQRHKSTEPKSQVQPLPPELPKAIEAETRTLDFHSSPLLRTGGLAIQIRRSVADLIRDTKGETIVKLRAFVAGPGDARRVQSEVSQAFGEHHLPFPVLSVLQVGSLEESAAQLILEAVVSTRKQLNPHGLAFFAGQTGSSLAGALKQLKKSVEEAKIQSPDMLQITCLTSRLESAEGVRASLKAEYPNSGSTLVQAVRDPPDDSSVCEAVARISETPPDQAVVLMQGRRTALVNAPKLIFTGLQLSFGNFLDDAHEAFIRLQRSASALQPVQAPILVNVFSLDPSGSSAIRKTMAVPPSTFTEQTIEGLPAVDASAGIEAIWASDTPAPLLK